MKKNLLLMMLCLPVMLAAQNGVTVSNLVVDAGTVTFNVSWNKPMPVEVWVDSAWVFVDYNKNGVMERLPVTSATASAGTVTKISGNDKGVWVAGNARTNDSFSAKVELFTEIKDVAGACAYASNYPPVGEYKETNVVAFTGTAPYTVVLEDSGGKATTYTVDSPFPVPDGCTVKSFTDKTGAPGILSGIYQPQGSCTFTRPLVVGTFAAFPSNYSASTYVTLTDERDNKNYEVVKIGNRWIMARNLNYQKGLTWRANSVSPSTVSGQNTTLIGNFWCPGGYSSTTTISTRESCDVYGALYSWETAMMLDGYGTWTEVSVYNTGVANAENSKFNHGRTAHSGKGTDGRGICPPNWHVPTDNEWGIILDGMESGGGTVHQSTGARAWIGTDAGTRGKSKCTVVDNTTSGDTYVNDTQANWYYDSGAAGADAYGFHVLPAGFREGDGHSYVGRGYNGYFRSSSAANDRQAWLRLFGYASPLVGRDYYARSLGMSVRCIRD